MELTVPSGDLRLAALLTLPDGPARAGLVTLHPAAGPQRNYFMFSHLAALLAPRGFAILSFDRRPAEGDDDVPFERQADDALAAVEVLSDRIRPGTPVGLWAFSQGAWAASLAAARSSRVAFLILVGASGVSPAAQMRYSTAEALRRAGHGDVEIDRALATRRLVEAFFRGEASHAEAQGAIDAVASEPWFDVLSVPRSLPPDARWTDMDFDPMPSMRGVRCPVLLVYGDDEAVPADQSIAAWREATGSGSERLDVVRLPDSRHLPTIGGVASLGAIDPAYEQAIVGWLDSLGTC
jgi:pimeloyl-ACP methyl ester carboxylesterase